MNLVVFACIFVAVIMLVPNHVGGKDREERHVDLVSTECCKSKFYSIHVLIPFTWNILIFTLATLFHTDMYCTLGVPFFSTVFSDQASKCKKVKLKNKLLSV